MSSREVAQRLASTLITRACRRLPDGAREDRLREWEAELGAILDDPGIRSPARRHAKAVLFAIGQRRTVRYLTRPTGARRLRAVTIRAAVAAAAAAIVLAAAAVALSPAADHAEYESSPAVAAEVYLALLATIAGLVCTALVAGLGLVGITRCLWNRQRRTAGTGARSGQRSARHDLVRATSRAWRNARTARGATAVFVAIVVCFTAAIVVSLLSQAAPNPSPAGSALGFLALAAGVTGLACATLLAALAVAGTATWLWRLAHGKPRPPPSRANPAR